MAASGDAKRQECLKHLRDSEACQLAFGNDVGDAPAKKRKYTNEDVMKEIQKVREEMTNKMDKMESRIITTVSNTTKLGQPSPTNEDDLYTRLGEKQTHLDCLHANLRNIDEITTCSICLDASSDALFSPCLHRVTCWEDWKKLEASAVGEGHHPRCPTCQKGVAKAVRLAES